METPERLHAIIRGASRRGWRSVTVRGAAPLEPRNITGVHRSVVARVDGLVADGGRDSTCSGPGARATASPGPVPTSQACRGGRGHSALLHAARRVDGWQWRILNQEPSAGEASPTADARGGSGMSPSPEACFPARSLQPGKLPRPPTRGEVRACPRRRRRASLQGAFSRGSFPDRRRAGRFGHVPVAGGVLPCKEPSAGEASPTADARGGSGMSPSPEACFPARSLQPGKLPRPPTRGEVRACPRRRRRASLQGAFSRGSFPDRRRAGRFGHVPRRRRRASLQACAPGRCGHRPAPPKKPRLASSTPPRGSDGKGHASPSFAKRGRELSGGRGVSPSMRAPAPLECHGTDPCAPKALRLCAPRSASAECACLGGPRFARGGCPA